MTCEPIEPGRWRLSFTGPEAGFLMHVLGRLGKQYQEKVAEMPPALRAYWQGTIARGGVAGREDLKEAQEVLAEARTELRAERLALVENWMREFELAEERNPWRVEISSAERDEIVAMLNDRRMLVALELGITESDMEADPGKISNETRRAGILEIDVLGHFILVMLGPQIYRP
jgi:BMFP domain-containing protein YqiC